MTEEEEQAYNEGCNAYRRERQAVENPYRTPSPAREAWAKGWEETRRREAVLPRP